MTPEPDAITGSGAPEVEFFPVPGTPAETLDLGRLALRRWRLDDIDEQAAVVERSVAHLTPFMGWAAEADLDMSREYLERCARQWAAREAFQYSMRSADDDAIVGSCGLMSRIGAGALEIGYWVAVDRVRQGFATLAVAGLTDAAFGLPGIERVEIHHDRANEVSGRVPARLGFTRLREEPVAPTAPDETGTHVVWAIQAAEWPGSPGRALLDHP